MQLLWLGWWEIWKSASFIKCIRPSAGRLGSIRNKFVCFYYKLMFLLYKSSYWLLQLVNFVRLHELCMMLRRHNRTRYNLLLSGIYVFEVQIISVTKTEGDTANSYIMCLLVLGFIFLFDSSTSFYFYLWNRYCSFLSLAQDQYSN